MPIYRIRAWMQRVLFQAKDYNVPADDLGKALAVARNQQYKKQGALTRTDFWMGSDREDPEQKLIKLSAQAKVKEDIGFHLLEGAVDSSTPTLAIIGASSSQLATIKAALSFWKFHATDPEGGIAIGPRRIVGGIDPNTVLRNINASFSGDNEAQNVHHGIVVTMMSRGAILGSGEIERLIEACVPE